MNVWRINLKTAGEDPRIFCLNSHIVGVGWQVDNHNSSLDWIEYKKLGEKQYKDKGSKGWWPALNGIKNRIQINDLVWTRDKQGVYYLGKITSEWRYELGNNFKKADVVNVRSCQWIKVGTVQFVPGKVVNSFIPRRTLQKIADETIRLYSKYLFNKLDGSNFYELNKTDKFDIFSLISSDGCEDILGLYLQLKKGYIIIPSSCKSDTTNYEYELLNKKTKEKAVVQVKNGDVNLNTTDFSNINSTIFLFTTKGKYFGKKENIHFIDPKQMENFIFSNLKMMPSKIQNWVSIYSELKKPVANNNA